MSRYHRTATIYKDRDCLVAALKDQGYATVETHAVAVQLFDFQGRKTHYTDKNGDKANVIVRRHIVGGAANDLGFLQMPDGTYSAIVSEYDGNKHNSTWMGQLTAKYAKHRVLKSTKALGFVGLSKPVSRNGKLILEVIR